MGAIHFEQMYDAALAVDRRAICAAIQLTDSRYNTNPTQPGLWENSAFDEVMAVARELDDLYATFLYSMRELVADRKAVPRMHSAITGQTVDVIEPDVMGYDDPVLSPDEYHEAMMNH